VHARYCLWPVRIYNIFPHYLINGTTLEKKLLNKKCVLIFCCTFFWNISDSKQNWARHFTFGKFYFKQSSATRNKCRTQLHCAHSQVTVRGSERILYLLVVDENGPFPSRRVDWSWKKKDMPWTEKDIIPACRGRKGICPDTPCDYVHSNIIQWNTGVC